MKIGLQIPSFSWPGGPATLGVQLGRLAGEVESAGFHSLWVMDHFFQIPKLGPHHDPMLEAYTTLGYLAGRTTTLQLGTLVTGVTYRHPGLLAKTVATLDVLSGGRAWMGIGAAWYQREHNAMGVPFPPLSERFERLEETLEILSRMWSPGSSAPYRGRHFRLEETLCEPQPVRKPPILIGGMGEKKTLRLVAKYGQACNLFEFAGLPVLHQKLEVLKAHCDVEGRNYDEISKTVLGQTVLRSEEAANKLVGKLEQLCELGFDHAIYSFKNPLDRRSLELFAEVVIPRVGSF